MNGTDEELRTIQEYQSYIALILYYNFITFCEIRNPLNEKIVDKMFPEKNF